MLKKQKFRPDLLLRPNIPKPLHGVNPRSIKGEMWWYEQRNDAYKKYRYCCWACGVFKPRAKYHPWLEAHESYIIDYKHGVVKLKEIVALCHACHNYIHDGRMQILVSKKTMTEKKMMDILDHGEAVLRKAGYKKFRPSPPEKCADWDKWRLLLDGKEYYSPYKNLGEWAKSYNLIDEN